MMVPIYSPPQDNLPTKNIVRLRRRGLDGAAASKASVPPKKRKNRIGSRERRRLKEEVSICVATASPCSCILL